MQQPSPPHATDDLAFQISDDLSVYRRHKDDLLDHLEVWSYLTRGRCADVAVSLSDAGRMHIRPFLLQSYMQGITDAMIREAVSVFLAHEKTMEVE